MEKERAAGWVVGLAAAIVYLNALPNGFVFDDLIAVTQNPFVINPRLMPFAFINDYWHGTSIDLLYRPLTVLTFGINNLVHGMRPFGFHLVNVGLHVIVSLLVLRLVRRLFGDTTLAFLTALLFALHPVHVEAVTSIVGRAELLMSLFSLLALHYYLEARDTPLPRARRLFVSCLLCYLLACFSKENGIMAPALMLLAEVGMCLTSGNWERFRGANLRRAAMAYGTIGAMAGMYLLIRFMAIGGLATADALGGKFSVRGSLIGFPWPLQFANALQYFVQYLRLLLWPVRLSSDYSYDQYPAHFSVWHWDIGLGALVLLVMVVVLLVSVRRAPPVFFGLAFFFVAFFPVSNFLIPILVVLTERSLYLPSLGIVLVAAWSLTRLAQWRPDLRWLRPAVYAVTIALVVLSTIRTVTRNRDWKDEVTLFTSAVRACPNCGNCWNCLGDALSDAGRYTEAIAAYARSLEIMPDHGVFHFRKANAQLKAGHVNEAVETYYKAVQYEPMLGDAYDQLGRIHTARGDFDAALSNALKAVSIQPEKAMFHYNLGYVFQRKAQLKEALAQYRDAARLNPEEPSYAFNLGVVQQTMGDLDGALASFYKAVELSPGNEKYWMTLSDALLKKGAISAAAQALEQFIQVSTNANMIAKAKGILEQIRKSNP